VGWVYRHRPTNRALQSADVELAWVMYEEGRLTIAEIASEIGVCAGTLGIYLREYRAAMGGLDFLKSLDSLRPPGARGVWGRQGRPPNWLAQTDQRRERVVELHAEGLTDVEIARELNAYQRTVIDDLRAMGLERRLTARRS